MRRCLRKAGIMTDSAQRRYIRREAATTDRSMPDVQDLAKRAQISVSESEVRLTITMPVDWRRSEYQCISWRRQNGSLKSTASLIGETCKSWIPTYWYRYNPNVKWKDKGIHWSMHACMLQVWAASASRCFGAATIYSCKWEGYCAEARWSQASWIQVCIILC